jgi:hypothetical protein
MSHDHDDCDNHHDHHDHHDYGNVDYHNWKYRNGQWLGLPQQQNSQTVKPWQGCDGLVDQIVYQIGS